MSYDPRFGKGPSPLTITLIAIVIVFGAYLLWTGFISWLETGSEQSELQRNTAVAGATDTSEAFLSRPTLAVFPSNTPLPSCEYFYVKGPEAAFVRECPSTDCEDVTYIEPDVSVCVIGRSDDPEYRRSEEWFEVLLDPDSFLPEIVYMHQSVLEALNPTATPTPTFEPLPTITPTPSFTATATPDPRTPTMPPPTSTDTPAATTEQIEI